MKDIYIAGRYDRREELAEKAQQLRDMGYTVDCRWLLGTHQLHEGAEKIDVDHHPEHGVSMLAAPFAQDDYEDLKKTDTIVFFSEPPDSHSKRGGRHVEFGMALAWGLRLIVIGQRENVFHCLPQVERYDTWEEFIDKLKNKRTDLVLPENIPLFSVCPHCGTVLKTGLSRYTGAYDELNHVAECHECNIRWIWDI